MTLTRPRVRADRCANCGAYALATDDPFACWRCGMTLVPTCADCGARVSLGEGICLACGSETAVVLRAPVR